MSIVQRSRLIDVARSEYKYNYEVRDMSLEDFLFLVSWIRRNCVSEKEFRILIDRLDGVYFREESSNKLPLSGDA